MSFHEFSLHSREHSAFDGNALITGRQSTWVDLQDGQEESIIRQQADVHCRLFSGLHAMVGHPCVDRGDDTAERANQAQVIQTSSPNVEKGGVGTPDSTSGGNAPEERNA